MNPWKKNQGGEKHVTAESSRAISRAPADAVIASRSTVGFDNEDHYRGIKGGSRREVLKAEKERNETKGEGEFSKEALMDRSDFENSKAHSMMSKDSQAAQKLAAGEMKLASQRMEETMLHRDSATNFFCWKSPNDSQEICYPSNSQGSHSLNFRHKMKRVKPPIYDELTCPVCGKLYSKAQLLPCNHNMCEHCIPRQKTMSNKGLKKHAVVTCPVCQENHHFTSTEKVKFPDNFLINEVLNRLEKRRKKPSKNKSIKKQPYCQLCESKNKQLAVKKCETCDLNFCKECLKQHDKTYTDHSFNEPSGGEPQMKCFDHPDSNLAAFCMADKIPICDECSKEKHKDHPTSTLQEAFKDQTIHLFHIIAKYGKVKDESENDMLRLSIFKSKLQENKTKFQKEVSDGFILLNDQLRQIEKQVKEIHENEINLKTAEVNRYLEATAKDVLNTEGLIQYAKEAVKEMNEFVLLQTVNNLIERLKAKVGDINISGHKLMANPPEPQKLDFEKILAQVKEIFSPVMKKYQLLQIQKASPASKKKINAPVEIQQDIKELEISSTPSEELQENNNEDQQEQKESAVSTASELSPERELSKTSQGDTVNHDVLVPPTIYHHTVRGNAAKIYWMVPEYDLVDSFDVHLQEAGNNNGATTPQQVGITFSGIDASSFETQLKANSEAIFRVRAVTTTAQSGWSYPYRVLNLAQRSYGKGNPAQKDTECFQGICKENVSWKRTSPYFTESPKEEKPDIKKKTPKLFHC
ncbi:tripartite motif-containing protein 42-like isoform X1 [Scyliorhinus torazame]|uniref:tripartite motif-containing protein 42-like isoform X1 n=1 Tax=Scyliorhinus torazame TaxID=75743 RepID=UPI003B5A7479